ncbi:histidine utilization repressor [Sphingomonas sp. SUN019]|uniref:histidine utilization repressor n=1 Tax=Sphingomonas sp. SUN019 TaxID=2937788 RepID=UPI0021642932|nr:histidine utilization repressor [Sphingomonas sp. SUN019]UVO49600.1 histidine utilization repressor [Sphingomonas sp. SUN019]
MVLTAAAPRYAAIKRHLLDAIRDGAMRPGDRLPSEAELVAMFGVSRMTANRALRELQAEGIVTRRAGAGSFIAEPVPIGHVIEIRNIAEEIRGRGHDYHAAVVQNLALEADARTAALLEVLAGTPVFHSIIVHHEAGMPLQLEDRVVLAAVAPDYGALDFTATTPNDYLTRVAPIERVEHRVRAELPDARTRDLLDLKAGDPVLVMLRQTWSGGRIASHARLTHPGRRFELAAAFTP